jgi:hypothetical protein
MLLRVAGGVLFVCVIGALLAGALVGDETRVALAEGGPACLFRTLTDLVCPFCGMTHATLDLGAGRFASALSEHPLAPLVALAVAWVGLRLARGQQLELFGRTIGSRALLAAVLAVWAVNLVAHA